MASALLICLSLVRFLLPIASICFIPCCPAWSRTGGNDIAALDNRRFGSALSAVAAVDRAVGLQRIVVIFWSSASQSRMQRVTPQGRDGPAMPCSPCCGCHLRCSGAAQDKRARLREEEEAVPQVDCQPLAGGGTKPEQSHRASVKMRGEYPRGC